MSVAPFGVVGLSEWKDSPTGTPRVGGEGTDDHVLVPILDHSVPAITDQVRVASALGRTRNALVHVVAPITFPRQTPAEFRHRVVEDADRELLQWAVEEAAERSPKVKGEFLYGRRLVNAVLNLVRSRDVDALVLPSNSSDGLLRRSAAGRLATDADCDVITVNGCPGYEPMPSILLPISGGPHSALATDVARWLAEANGAWIDVLHVVEENPSPSRRELAERYVETACQRISRPETPTSWVLEAGDVADAIIEQSKYYGLTVVGAPTTGRLRRFVSGSTNRTVRSEAHSLVLTGRSHGSDALFDS